MVYALRRVKSSAVSCAGFVLRHNISGSALTKELPELDYRADLDGMRGIAVLTVLLFHLDKQLMPGGYVGVDVFFVLSGYFITRILVRDIDNQSFSLIGFYDRRIRRLLPALFVMLLVVLVAGFILTGPNAFEVLGAHTLGAATSLNNILFWQSSGYFGPQAEELPLLHTWSLAVEEQFYLLYPVLLLALSKWASAWRAGVLIALSLGSFAVSVWWASANPDAAFYLPFSRFWELSLGGLIVFAEIRRRALSPLMAEVFRAAGLVAIAIALFRFDENTLFPGYAALLPCVGTALIIWARPDPGVGAETILSQVLSWKPLVATGLISYSLYLWHWPIFVFGRYLSFEPPGILMLLLFVGLSFAAAYLSWRFVERPLRKPNGIWRPRSKRYRHTALAIGAFGVVALGIGFTDGLPGRMPPNVTQLAKAMQDFSPHRSMCHLARQGEVAFEDLCTFGPESAPDVYVLSDSHGTELSYALAQRAERDSFHLTQITSNYCPPSLGLEIGARPGCRAHNESMVSALSQQPPGTVIIVAYWMHWDTWPEQERFWSGISNTIERLNAAGHHVVLLGPTQPFRNGTLARAVVRQAILDADLDDLSFTIERPAYDLVEARLMAYAEKEGVSYVPILEDVCQGTDNCRAVMDGSPIYFDSHHITVRVAAGIIENLAFVWRDQSSE